MMKGTAEDPGEFIDLIREVLRLGPLPPEPERSRKRCPCGRKHRSFSAKCFRCTGWKHRLDAKPAAESERP